MSKRADRSITVPAVHRRGTPRKELLRQLLVAGHALNDALDKLREAAPDERDYRDEPLAYKKASREHDNRCADLVRVQNEIQRIANALGGMSKRYYVKPCWHNPTARLLGYRVYDHRPPPGTARRLIAGEFKFKDYDGSHAETFRAANKLCDDLNNSRI